MIIAIPYSLKTNQSIVLDTKKPCVVYQMGWFGRNDDDKKNDSGATIDWDAYDRLNNTNYKPEDRGTIEVPANAETIIYESPDGQTYEIPVSDLIEADDEGEITYSSKGRSILNPIYKSRVNRNGRRLKSPTMLLGQQRSAHTR